MTKIGHGPLGQMGIDRDHSTRPCEKPGCEAEGMFRAPRSRTELDVYYWFCLDHVREYNKAWNYYADMSEEEIETLNRDDTIWQRPTWPLGARQLARGGRYRIGDRVGMFDGNSAPPRREERGLPRRGTPEAWALSVMDLEPPITLERIKARYKVLVKRLHPDANGGDSTAEERLKLINEAYTTLRNWAPA